MSLRANSDAADTYSITLSARASNDSLNGKLDIAGAGRLLHFVELREASVTGVNVMSVCSCRATQVWPPLPFQKGEHVGVNLFGGGHACPPVEPVCTLQLCRTGCKWRRNDLF